MSQPIRANSHAASALESLVDSHGLCAVLECLADICKEKAEHLRTNWQDAGQARLWDNSGDLVQRTAEEVTTP
jgi:hypothetical protein